VAGRPFRQIVTAIAPMKIPGTCPQTVHEIGMKPGTHPPRNLQEADSENAIRAARNSVFDCVTPKHRVSMESQSVNRYQSIKPCLTTAIVTGTANRSQRIRCWNTYW
jgi:hypothetical protein